MHQKTNNTVREPPIPPEEWECCGSDCGESCIYSLYQKEKAEYEAWLAQQSKQGDHT